MTEPVKKRERRRYLFLESSIQSLHRWFREAGRDGVEDIAIAAGLDLEGGDALITTVLHPNADRAEGWYEQRDGITWDELYMFGFNHGLSYLLQLHTHPHGCSTRHSRRDDAGAFSDRLGFLSIVIPDFADGGIDLHSTATTVHERVRSGWRIWSAQEATERLVLLPSEVDFQSDSTAVRSDDE